MNKRLNFIDDNGTSYPEWEYLPLNKISDVVKRVAKNPNGLEVLTISAGFGFLNQKDRFSQVIAGNSLSKYTLLRKGELSYNRGASSRYKYGCVYSLKDYDHALVPNIYRSFRLHDGYLSEFYEQLFSYGYANKQLRTLISSGARMDGLLNIGQDEFYGIKVPVPSLLEQQKIAEFFSALDERIALTADKVKLLKEQKAGYLQKVFARELVFTDDNGDRFAEWEQKKLGEVALVTMGQSPDGKSYSEDSNDMVLIQGNADMKNGYIVPRIYTSEPTKTCEAGDIIMSVRAPVGAFAKTDITACLGRGVCSISANDYVYQYLKYHSSIGGWSKLAQGSTFEAVSSTDVKTLSIPLPSSPEQEKIAEFFSSLDVQIELTENKLALLKEQKKGYLQGIFG